MAKAQCTALSLPRLRSFSVTGCSVAPITRHMNVSDGRSILVATVRSDRLGSDIDTIRRAGSALPFSRTAGFSPGVVV